MHILTDHPLLCYSACWRCTGPRRDFLAGDGGDFTMTCFRLFGAELGFDQQLHPPERSAPIERSSDTRDVPSCSQSELPSFTWRLPPLMASRSVAARRRCCIFWGWRLARRCTRASCWTRRWRPSSSLGCRAAARSLTSWPRSIRTSTETCCT